MSETSTFEAACLGWWSHLTNRDIGQSRADLARLKRAASPLDALSLRCVHDLNRRLAAAGADMRGQPAQLALIARVLAHVKTHGGSRLAQRMGQGEPKPLSPLRFDRLIRTTDPEELTTHLRRALAVVGHGANVAQLAQDLRWWNDSTRARWCFDYYGASFAAPDTEQSEETEA